MSVLWGDPASVSALAATLRRAALHLAADSGAVDQHLREATPGWTGRAAVHTRRRAAAVVAETARTAEALDAVGRRLQSAVTELAETVARLHRLEDEAAAAGLEIRDGAVHERWGIVGVADPEVAQAEAENRRHLQERLRTALAALGRQRADLARDCAHASARLREATAALRG